MIRDIFHKNIYREHKKRQAENRARLGFQEFVIHRFLIILLYVVMSEYIVKSLLDEYMFPAMHRWFFDNLNWDSDISMAKALLFVLFVLIEIIFTVVYNFVPNVAKSGVHVLMQRIDSIAIDTIPELGGSAYNLELGAMEMVLLILMILAVIVLVATPLIVAAIWFSKIIINEVRRVEKNKEALHKDYESKRNLMLSDIAHDLRTPITTIAGYAKALNDGMVTDEEKKKEYLEAIENKSQRMSDLINLLFEYVKLDSTEFSLNKEKTDLAELLRENAAMLYSDVEEKGLELEIGIPEESCMIDVDALQFSRVITNLITNAIRHNEKGTVISLKMTQEDDEVTVIVSDNGTEIPKEIAEHIFEPFTVGDVSRKTKGGSGLGLSIAKKIVDMHGWSLELRQEYLEYKKAFIIKIK